MTDPQYEFRLSAVENDLAYLKARQASYVSDAQVARDLAAATDRDVADFREVLTSHTRVLNALRETQVEHGRRLANIDGQLEQVDGRLVNIDGQLVQILDLLTARG